MKKYVISLIICLTVGLSGVFTACNNDVPTIDYQHESKYTADFSKLIEAIRSQTTTLEKKLELINQALNDVNASLKDKLNLIEVAVAEGVGTYKEYAEKIIEAIDNLNATQDAKLQAIYEILASNNASLELQLAAIEEAVKAGFGTYKEMAEALIKSINDLNASQAEKLQLIYDILKSELATLSQKVADVEAAIKAGFLDNQAALKALQDAIVAALANDQKDLSDRLKELNDALTAIKGSLDSNFKLSADAIATLTNELIEVLYNNQVSTNTKLANIEDAIRALSGTVTAEYAKVAELLKQIADAVEAGADYSEIIAAIKAIVIPDPQPKYEAVDLGLSVKWATFNVGAKSETDYGDKFAWGETAPKTEYTERNYKWGIYNNDDPNKGMTKYNKIDGLETLQPEDDAATANWGDDWRTPTIDECKELNDYCDWTRTTKKGVNGYTVTSKKNGNSIFLPGTKLDDAIVWFDNYWSSSLDNYNVGTAYDLFFRYDGWHDASSAHGREYGFVVRPVMKPSSER